MAGRHEAVESNPRAEESPRRERAHDIDHSAVVAPLGGNLANGVLVGKNAAGEEVGDFTTSQYGGSVGGPVYIPGKYNTDKTKTFFFASVEARRRNVGLVLRGAMIPEPMRNGDFTNSPTFLASSGFGSPVLDLNGTSQGVGKLDGGQSGLGGTIINNGGGVSTLTIGNGNGGGGRGK